MKRSHWHPTRCYDCGVTVEQVGRISAKGRCYDCGQARLNANNDQLIEHAGPWFEHWRQRTLAAFGVFVVDSEDEAA